MKDIDVNWLIAIGTIVLILVGIVALAISLYQGRQAKKMADDTKRIADETERVRASEHDKQVADSKIAADIKLGSRGYTGYYHATVKLSNYTSNAIRVEKLELIWWHYDRPSIISSKVIEVRDTLGPNDRDISKEIRLADYEAKMDRGDLGDESDILRRLHGLLHFKIRAHFTSPKFPLPLVLETEPKRWV